MKHFLLPLVLVALLGAPFNRAAETAVAPAPAEAPVLPSTIEPSDQNYQPRLGYQVYFQDYLTLKKGKAVDLVFIGDSITEQWRWGAGWPVWREHFEERALNFGLGADRTQHAIWRLQNIDLGGFAPKVAVILIGTNNTQDTPENIAKGVQAVIAATQVKFAGIKIILVSILPNARATEKMATANALIAPFADGQTVFHLDLAAKFTAEGDNWKGLSRDKLHLSAEGYAMWAAEIRALLPVILP